MHMCVASNTLYGVEVLLFTLDTTMRCTTIQQERRVAAWTD